MSAGSPTRCRRVQLALVVLALAIQWPAQADDLLGRMISDFELRDVHGQSVTLNQWREVRVVIVAFLGTECPLAKLYAPRLDALAGRWDAADVAMLAVFPNRQDSLEELALFARRYELNMPVLKDVGNQVADLFEAARTPEVFVLDADRVVRYHGRVDDQYLVGVQRDEPTRHDLVAAVDDLLAGEPVSVPSTTAQGCLIGRVQPVDEEAEVTWASHIAALVQQHCQECHRPGEIGPFSLLTYEDSIGWGPMMAEVVAEGRMPPWHANPQHGHFSNDPRLTDGQKQLIFAWVAAGQPAGDLSAAPPPRDFVEGWRIEQPDTVIYMSDEPFDVPAEGIVDYQWFFADTNFAEDRWIVAAEARPGAAEVVHHVTIYLKPPGVPFELRHNDRIALLAGYNPGGGPWNVPAGMAVKIPAGSQLVFEMHYTPNGRPQQDRSYVGLVFAEPDAVAKEAICVMPANGDFAIPPGDPDYRIETAWEFPADALLLVMRPHMHLRGKAFRYEAIYPDGQHEVLLDVPHYDFNWQHNYILSKPKRIPGGTRLVCTGWFDNSSDNPSNPDPAATVRWGDQSSDEMMIGTFAMALADQNLQQQSRPEPSRQAPQRLAAVVAGLVGTILLAVALRCRRRA